jgi:hypothetical protein
VPQPWLPKPSGRIAFPPPAAGLVAAGTSGAVDAVGMLGAVGAAGSSGPVGTFGANADISEKKEGSLGGHILAALLTNRVVYSNGKFIYFFYSAAPSTPFRFSERSGLRGGHAFWWRF